MVFAHLYKNIGIIILIKISCPCKYLCLTLVLVAQKKCFGNVIRSSSKGGKAFTENVVYLPPYITKISCLCISAVLASQKATLSHIEFPQEKIWLSVCAPLSPVSKGLLRRSECVIQKRWPWLHLMQSVEALYPCD